ncbi:MAG TPA: hypothetical protein VIB82_01550 [Caulobacteraceae bacterium]|jgi:hypothetical protein
MSDPKPPPTGLPASWFFGAALMAIGALMVLLCGVCSLVFFPSIVGNGPHGVANTGGGVLTVAIFGGIPIAVGVGLFFVGLGLCRQR